MLSTRGRYHKPGMELGNTRPRRPHGGRATVKQADSADNVGGLQNIKYRKVEKPKEGRGPFYVPLSQVLREPIISTT